MQVHPSRNYIPAVISSSNYTSLPFVKIADDRLNFYFHFLFYFIFHCFHFIFLFLEQLGLGVISHTVTSVTT